MKGNGIRFFTEGVRYTFRGKRKLREALIQVLNQEGCKPGAINFIVCNDEFLGELNREYLRRETFTDVIAFDYSEGELMGGDIYISIDRIRENATTYHVSETEELYRVMIHGVLHLTGMTDEDPKGKKAMHDRENQYLEMLFLYVNQ